MSEQTMAYNLTHIDLAGQRYDGQVLACSDDFFAEASNMLALSEPIYIADKYTENGKWMDGWESRRRRDGGYDWAIVKLGVPGIIDAIDVNTRFFKGNSPQEISVEASSELDAPDDDTQWTTLIARQDVDTDSHNFYEIDSNQSWQYLRLNIFPDGGVARFRVYGTAVSDWSTLADEESVDLAYGGHGGRSIACSDMFFSAMNNIIAPGRGVNMGDGWETRRRRGPGYDWLVVQLAAVGTIDKLIIDTRHFKGNYPDTCSVEVCLDCDPNDLDAAPWQPLLAECKLGPHQEHTYEKELLPVEGDVGFVRLNIFPDGGVSRFRVFGKPVSK